MHIESYNCIGEENEKKFYAKLKELEDEAKKQPRHWSPDLQIETLMRYGIDFVFDEEDYDILNRA